MGHTASTSKITRVSDGIHGSIALSPIEKAIISTSVYNRLHNILQNSTAYLTYPSARTSRFAHSLGCAHIAGSIFVNAFNNASAANRIRFLKEADAFLTGITGSTSFRNNLKTSNAQHSLNPGSLVAVLLRQPFYGQVVPSAITAEKDRVAFLAILQSVRIAALVHDLGHPPFSHIVEAALSELYENVSNIPKAKRTERHRRLADIFNKLEKKDSNWALRCTNGLDAS